MRGGQACLLECWEDEGALVEATTTDNARPSRTGVTRRTATTCDDADHGWRSGCDGNRIVCRRRGVRVLRCWDSESTTPTVSVRGAFSTAPGRQHPTPRTQVLHRRSGATCANPPHGQGGRTAEQHQD